jgi:hypothetical protein
MTRGLTPAEQAAHMMVAQILDGAGLDVLGNLRVLASIQFRYCAALAAKGHSTRSEALTQAAEVTARTWAELEELQKPHEIKRAIVADIVAADLVNKTLALSRPKN